MPHDEPGIDRGRLVDLGDGVVVEDHQPGNGDIELPDGHGVPGCHHGPELVAMAHGCPPNCAIGARETDYSLPAAAIMFAFLG